MGFGRRKKHILVVSNVGQANEQRLKLLLEEVCRIKENGYQRNADECESEKYYSKVYFNTDGANQDRIGIKNIKSTVKAIICFENLNPRSNSLKANLEELRYVFHSDELRKKLNVILK
jgi:hypothetical protein